MSEPGVGAHEANGDHTNRAEGASSPTIETRSPTPGIVVVGFVLSVLGLTVLAPLAVPGLIVSIVARRTVKRLRAAGGGLALAGILPESVHGLGYVCLCDLKGCAYRLVLAIGHALCGVGSSQCLPCAG